MKKTHIKAIALFSGGLDSILAAKVVLNQGIEVEGVIFTSAFYPRVYYAKTAAEQLGIKLKIIEVSREFFKILKNPKHGYGSNLNPCIDCHIFMIKKAAEYMKKVNADFLITGEVLGERPMSQNKASLRLIEKEAGVKGFLLRPLSAKLLEPTMAEEKGLVDREQLLSISGRSRKPQIKLAEDFGIHEYPAPAGGCFLTEPGFSRRMKDLMKHKENFTVNDVELLRLGRHFRLREKTKVVVGRNELENKKLLELAKKDDYCFYPVKRKGPVAVARGIFIEEDILTAARVMARYCDASLSEELKVSYKKLPERNFKYVTVLPMPDKEIELLRI